MEANSLSHSLENIVVKRLSKYLISEQYFWRANTNIYVILLRNFYFKENINNYSTRNVRSV